MLLPVSLKFIAIGTHWQIDFFDKISEIQIDNIKKQILFVTENFDQSFSRFRSDSWINKNAFKAGTSALPTDAFKLLKLYQKLFKITDGTFTPCIGQVLTDAGYNSTYTLEPKELAQPLNFDKIKFTQKTIIIPESVILDFGAAGKGYLVDILTQLIMDFGIQNFWIDGSGDLYNHSQKNMKIGLEDPADFSRIIGVANLPKDFSLCASAGSRRKWQGYHHIINPKTLASPSHILATWVIAKSAMTADALATALFLATPEKLQSKFKFEYCFLTQNRQIKTSKNFPGIF